MTCNMITHKIKWFFSKIEFQDFSRLFFKAHLALMRIWLLLLLCCVALSDIRFLAQQDFCAPNLINNFLILSLSLLLCLKILKIVSFYTPSTHLMYVEFWLRCIFVRFLWFEFSPTVNSRFQLRVSRGSKNFVFILLCPLFWLFYVLLCK